MSAKQTDTRRTFEERYARDDPEITEADYVPTTTPESPCG